MRRRTRRWLLIPAILLALCLLLVAGLAVSNLFLPEASAASDELAAAEKARLAEVFHLRHELGERIWPGWGEAQIPVIVYNEDYAFLLGYPGEPPAGWATVPQNEEYGGPWQLVPGDDFQGEPYYRQPLPDPDVTPQAYTVRVGDEWVASMQTREYMSISLVEQFGEDLPGPVAAIFPYRLADNLFLGGSEKYVSLILHESFHGFEGIEAPERLAEAEWTGRRLADDYPWDDEGLEAAWQEELDLLADMLEEGDEAALPEMVRQFLALRAARREQYDLGNRLVAYEQRREWAEGLAKYVEMEVWRQAGTVPGYEPLDVVRELDDFDMYADSWEGAWNRETDQIRRMAGDEGDGRFYYTGMAQARLLDRLAPGWKEKILSSQEIYLEELLSAAVNEREVTVYFNNSTLDPDMRCDVVFPVTRSVAAGADSPQAALEALFAGPTPAEEEGGYSAFFSEETAGAVRDVKVEGSYAYVNLSDIRPIIPNASSSCGSQSLLAQMDATVRDAAPEVRQVVYAIDGDPAPFYEWLQIGCGPANDNCNSEPFAGMK